MRELVLEFQGYWTEASEQFIPDQPGVYCVYRARHEPLSRKVLLRELLYIGQSDRVRSAIAAHGKKPEWKEHLKEEETLCYSFSPILYDRDRAEAALIHQHKPPENINYVHDFPFNDTAVFLIGKTLLLTDAFAVLEYIEVA